MKVIDSSTVLDRLHDVAFNSSHYVLLISDFLFYQGTTGWIFAITKKMGVTLVALEPLPPQSGFSDDDFFVAIEEFQKFFATEPIAFISVGEKFAAMLNQRSFYNLRFGKEPWVNLADFEPKGNKGKGIRAAKNQAVREGLTVEEWKLSELYESTELKSRIDKIHHTWVEKSFMSLEGFLLKTDPWKLMEDRICFIAKSKSGSIEGVLIATPIVRDHSWYMEDMWIEPMHTRGVGELLTLDAMAALKEKNAQKVSLGLIPFMEPSFEFNDKKVSPLKPMAFSLCVNFFLFLTKSFYNANGLILFRKRFNIESWTSSFISIRVTRTFPLMKTFQWCQVVAALIVVHRPQFYLKNYLPSLLLRRKPGHR